MKKWTANIHSLCLTYNNAKFDAQRDYEHTQIVCEELFVSQQV
jgi:hypothetical protein